MGVILGKTHVLIWETQGSLCCDCKILFLKSLDTRIMIIKVLVAIKRKLLVIKMDSNIYIDLVYQTK